MKLLTYSLLRLAAFVVPFAIMWQFPIFHEQWMLAGLFSAMIGLALSLLFLRKPLNDATAAMVERRASRYADDADVTDEDAEDAAIENPITPRRQRP